MNGGNFCRSSAVNASYRDRSTQEAFGNLVTPFGNRKRVEES